MKYFILCILLLQTSFLYSEENIAAAPEKSNSSLENRKKHNYGLNAIFAPIDVLVYGKYGLSFYKATEEKNTQYELQYLKASYAVSIANIDFAKMTDQRLSFFKRNFSDSGNFNWYYGLSYISFDASFGSNVLNNLVPGSNLSEAELVKIQTIGFDFGLGHRWYFDNNMSLSVDWFGVSQPLAILKKEAPYAEAASTSDTDKSNAKSAVDIITFFPRLQALKLSLGYNF